MSPLIEDLLGFGIAALPTVAQGDCGWDVMAYWDGVDRTLNWAVLKGVLESFLGFSRRCFEGFVFDSFPFAGVRPKLHGTRAVCVLGDVAAEAKARGDRKVIGEGRPEPVKDVADGGLPGGDAALFNIRAGKKDASATAASYPLPVKRAPSTPPPSVLFQAHKALPGSGEGPEGSHLFFYGWIPLPDAQQRTYWWNTVDDSTTYDFPFKRADETIAHAD